MTFTLFTLDYMWLVYFIDVIKAQTKYNNIDVSPFRTIRHQSTKTKILTVFQVSSSFLSLNIPTISFTSLSVICLVGKKVLILHARKTPLLLLPLLVVMDGD